MFPFWDPIIAPLVDAVAPQRIVEIGALRGDTTVRLLEQLGDDAELHVIDPEPQFDPGEHERAFPGRYVFHRDLSLRVLATLSPVDLALIDGDHNWYTVSRELELLRTSARGAACPAPVLVLHDVAWPYGRRDGYYAPDQIPAEHRRPCARLGLERGNPELVDDGGLNRHIWNAEREGGPHNGVLTALEDFVASHHPEFRYVVLDLFVGLAIAADRERLAQSRALRDLFDSLDAPETRAEIREQVEAVVQQAFASNRSVR